MSVDKLHNFLKHRRRQCIFNTKMKYGHTICRNFANFYKSDILIFFFIECRYGCVHLNMYLPIYASIPNFRAHVNIFIHKGKHAHIFASSCTYKHKCMYVEYIHTYIY